MDYEEEKGRIAQKMQQRAVTLCSSDAVYQNLLGQLQIINKIQAEVKEE